MKMIRRIGLGLGVGMEKTSVASIIAAGLGAVITNSSRTHVVITFGTYLKTSSVPAISAFTLAGKTINNVAVSGMQVTLTVTVAYHYGEVVTVDYTKPALNHLTSADGDVDVDSFTGMEVVNNIVSPIPSGMTLTLITGGVKIDWTDNSSGIFTHEIWGKSNSGAYALVATVVAGTVTYSNTLASVTLRYYKIKAVHGTIESIFNTEQSIAMLAGAVDLCQIEAPSALTLTPYDDVRMDLVYTVNSTRETGFYIERSLDGSTGWTVVHTNATGVGLWSDTGRTTDTRYYYRIRSYVGLVLSPYCDIANAYTKLATLPTGLTLSLLNGGIKIDWTDASSGTHSTEIWAQSNGAVSELLTTINPGITTYNNIITSVDLRYIKLRSTTGSNQSNFTVEQSIAMLGAEKMPALSVWAATGLAWWSQVGAGWTGDGNKMSCDGTIHFCDKFDFWTLNKKYQISITTVRTSGTLEFPYDGSSSPANITSSTTTILDYVPTVYAHLFLSSVSYLGDVTALSIKENLAFSALPTGLTLTGISGGVKIDWTANPLCQTEIWGRSDSGVSTLLYTINAGTVTKNDTITPVDIRYYKLRSKRGTVYSDFTAEQSIAMLGAELCTNGDFHDTSWWVNVGSCTITNGVCHYNTPNLNEGLAKEVLTIGKHYKIVYTILNHVSGSFWFRWNGGTSYDTKSGNGTFTINTGEVITSSYVLLYSYDGGCVLDIDNISVKEILYP